MEKGRPMKAKTYTYSVCDCNRVLAIFIAKSPAEKYCRGRAGQGYGGLKIEKHDDEGRLIEIVYKEKR